MPNTISMPDFVGHKQLLLNEINNITPELEHASAIIDDALQDVPEFGRSFDARDFIPMSLLIPPGAQHDSEVRNLCLDFASNDPSRRTPWLNQLYSFRESVKVPDLDPGNQADVRTAIQCFSLNQTAGTMETSNPEYYQARYADPVGKEKMLLQDQTQLDLGYLLQTIAMNEGHPLDAGMTLPINPLGVEAAEKKLANSLLHYQVRALGDKLDAIPFTATKDFGLFAHTKIDSIQAAGKMSPIADKDRGAKKNVRDAVGEAFNHLDMRGKNGLSRDDLVLIDGKSITSIIDSKNMPLSRAQREQMSLAMIATALTSGKNRVDAVFLRMGADGKTEPIIQPVKPDLTALGDTIEQDYSKFRRTFFNWGPWKCKTRAEKVEELFAKPVPSGLEAKLKTEAAKIAAKADSFVTAAPEKSFMEEYLTVHAVENTRELQTEKGMTTTLPQNPQRTTTSIKELTDSVTAPAPKRLSQPTQARSPSKAPPVKE
ncbi:MAG: hypothetical protein RR185_04145 [Angelakisella sp.]